MKEEDGGQGSKLNSKKGNLGTCLQNRRKVPEAQNKKKNAIT